MTSLTLATASPALLLKKNLWLPGTLTDGEDNIAVVEGTARQARRVLAGVPRDKYTFCDDAVGGHIFGVRGEIVLSKVLGLNWRATIYKKDEADLDNYIEVRLRSKHWYEIFIHPEETRNPKKMHRPYFLITKEEGDPIYRVHGYVTPAEAREIGVYKKVKEENPASFFVYQDHMNPVQEFIDMLKET